MVGSITLYESTEQDFLTNGLGGLPDSITCHVVEERNGGYELEMEYPVTGLHFDEIEVDRIIFCKPSPNKDEQAFRIYMVEKPISGRVTIRAEHIRGQLGSIPVMPFDAVNLSDALDHFVTDAAESCPFTFWTDKTVGSPFKNTTPASILSRLGGSDDSILEVYKGEYEWDNWTVKLWTNRGANRGVSIRYGKNLTDLKQEEDFSAVYTGICPYWLGQDDNENDVIVTLPENVLYSAYADLYSFNRTRVVDLSSEFQDPPSVAELRSRAKQYMEANFVGVPSISLTVSFVNLYQTEEYKNIASLETVNLCDTITIIFDELGISSTAKIVKTDYDVLTGRYISVEIGTPRSNLANTISNQSKEIKKSEVESVSRMEKELARATKLITGGLGGNVVINYNADGKPNEILIMDTEDIESAVNVIRANQNGIGFSQNGYNGPFNSAWTIDGTLDMAQINVANLVADLIRGGTLKLGGSVFAEAGVLKLYDEKNKLIGQMDKNGMRMNGRNGSYVLMNAEVGFAGYDRNDNPVFWVNKDEFHMKKGVIDKEVTMFSKVNWIPVTVKNNQNVVINDGIAAVSVLNVS